MQKRLWLLTMKAPTLGKKSDQEALSFFGTCRQQTQGECYSGRGEPKGVSGRQSESVTGRIMDPRNTLKTSIFAWE